MLVIEAPAGLGGRAQPGQPGPHAIRRQVTDPAVVLVTAAVLAHLGNLKVTDSPDPGGEFFHGHDVTGRPVPPGAGLGFHSPPPGLPAPPLTASTLSGLPSLAGRVANTSSR